MPQHVFTVIARGHAVDAQTNQLTLFGVIETVGAPSAPVRLPEISIVTLWSRNEDETGIEFVQRTRLLDPSGNQEQCFETNFRLDRPRMRIIAQLTGVRFESSGTYHIEIGCRAADGVETWPEPSAMYPIVVDLPQEATEADLFEEQ